MRTYCPANIDTVPPAPSPKSHSGHAGMSPSPGRVRSGAVVSATPGAPGAGAIVATVDVVASLVVVVEARRTDDVVDSTTCAGVVVGTVRAGVTGGAGASVSGVVGKGSNVVVGKGSCAALCSGSTRVSTVATAAIIPSKSAQERTNGA